MERAGPGLEPAPPRGVMMCHVVRVRLAGSRAGLRHGLRPHRERHPAPPPLASASHTVGIGISTPERLPFHADTRRGGAWRDGLPAQGLACLVALREVCTALDARPPTPSQSNPAPPLLSRPDAPRAPGHRVSGPGPPPRHAPSRGLDTCQEPSPRHVAWRMANPGHDRATPQPAPPRASPARSGGASPRRGVGRSAQWRRRRRQVGRGVLCCNSLPCSISLFISRLAPRPAPPPAGDQSQQGVPPAS